MVKLIGCACLLLLVSACQLATGADISTLKLVHAIWRHGERSPEHLFPTDLANNASTWLRGLGELTNEGMRQSFALGKWLRRRYNGFLSTTYKHDQIFVRSTAYGRTVMSGMAVMAGLYQPLGDDVWDKNVSWLPIPVYSEKATEDPMLYSLQGSAPCLALKETIKKLNEKPEVRRLLHENADLLAFLANRTGIGGAELAAKDLYSVYDPLFIEQLYANDTHDWPTWMNATVWNRFKALDYAFIRHFFDTPRLQRLSAGLLLNDILARMERRANDSSLEAELKFFAYSAHDVTIAAFLSTLGYNFASEWPQFASVVLVELHENGDQYVVQVFFKNATYDDIAHPVPVANCPQLCTLQQFRQRSRELIPENWRLECGIVDPSTASSRKTSPIIYLVIISLMTCMIFCLAFFLMIILVNYLRFYTIAWRRKIAEGEESKRVTVL